MKLALHSHPHQLELKLSERAREALLGLCQALIPYAIAAAAVFAYHEQWLL